MRSNFSHGKKPSCCASIGSLIANRYVRAAIFHLLRPSSDAARGKVFFASAAKSGIFELLIKRVEKLFS
jgi:hypothetical protein